MYSLIFGGLFIAWCCSEIFGPARWRGEGAVQRDQGSLRVATFSGILGLLFYFLFPFVPFTTIAWEQPLFFFIGIGVVLLGSSFRWYSILTLGKWFTGRVMVQADQPIVRHGPYRIIRHPSYLGIVIVVLGMGIIIANWASCLAIVLGLLVGLLNRIQVEEKALLEMTGDYQEYMRECPYKLIPFIF